MGLVEATNVLQKRINCKNANMDVCMITTCENCSNFVVKEDLLNAYDTSIKAMNYCRMAGVHLVSDRDAEKALDTINAYCSEHKRSNCEGCTFALTEDRCRLRDREV